MQIQKEHIRNAIVESARKEFMKRGFRKASMRAIAFDADVTLSNIYNYFPDKDALFCEIFAEILENLRLGQKFIETVEKGPEHHDMEYHMRLMDKPIQYVYAHRDMFDLLLYHSEGSSLSDLPEEVTRWFARIMQLSVEAVREKYGIQAERPSEYLTHYIGAMWVHFIMDSVRYKLPVDKALESGRQIMSFVIHGWSGMLGAKME